MLEIVVENTNKYIDTVSVNYGDCEKYKVKRTTVTFCKLAEADIKMMGIEYFCCVMKTDIVCMLSV
jgi:hypothetical protein